MSEKDNEPLVIHDKDIRLDLVISHCNIRGDIVISDCRIDKDVIIRRNVIGGKMKTSHTVVDAKTNPRVIEKGEGMSEYCCERFRYYATHYEGGPFARYNYPPAEYPEAQIVLTSDGTWSVNGCCGGGCFVIEDMKYCPFCGCMLNEKEEEAKTAG